MNTYRTKNIYYLFAIIIYIASMYNLFIYIDNNELFFTNTALLIPAMQKIPLSYSSWFLEGKLIFFPDVLLVNIIQMFTSNIKAIMITYILLMTTCIYGVFTYVAGIRYHIVSTICLYTLFWTMILIFIFSKNSLFSFFFVPNGYIGFTLIYFIVMRLGFNLLSRKASFTQVILITILITLMASSTPIITSIYLGIPLFILIKIARRMGYSMPRGYLSIEILIILSLILGYVIQSYTFSFTNLSSSISLFENIHFFYTSKPLLFILGCIGGLYCIIHGFTHSLDYSYVYVNRAFGIGMLLAIVAVAVNLINPQFFILFFLFIGICYGLPLLILEIMSLISVQMFVLVHTLVVAGAIFSLFFLYWNNSINSEPIYNSIINRINLAVENKEKSQYIMAPKELSHIISIFNKNNVTVIPYNTNTLEYALFNPTFMEDKKYTALIIDKNSYKGTLMQELITLIGKPSRHIEYNEYDILSYPEGFIMPDSGMIATYTTPLGNSVRNTIQEGINIPIAKNFIIDDILLSGIKILEIDTRIFVVLMFPKNAVIPKKIEYNVYTLSPLSSGFRKLFSGIRRELPALGSILPLEDKSTLLLQEKDLYILPSGEHVAVINITDKVKQTLMFLSISIGNNTPTIILEYPDLPILLGN